MMSTEQHDRCSILHWIAQYYAPETCAAIDFQMFTDYIGDQSHAELLIRELMVEGLVSPLSSETKLSGGTKTGKAATIDGPIKLSNRFVISEKGLSAVELLFDPARGSAELSSQQVGVDSLEMPKLLGLVHGSTIS